MKTFVRIVTVACMALAAAGCGFKGDLVLPDENVPVETSEPGATDVKKTPDT